jgi:hypothetical protein
MRFLLRHGHCLGLQPSDELSFNGSHMYTEKAVLYQDAWYAHSARTRFRVTGDGNGIYHHSA